MSSFSTVEPSEAMIKALQARLSAKGDVAHAVANGVPAPAAASASISAAAAALHPGRPPAVVVASAAPSYSEHAMAAAAEFAAEPAFRSMASHGEGRSLSAQRLPQPQARSSPTHVDGEPGSARPTGRPPLQGVAPRSQEARFNTVQESSAASRPSTGSRPAHGVDAGDRAGPPLLPASPARPKALDPMELAADRAEAASKAHEEALQAKSADLERRLRQIERGQESLLERGRGEAASVMSEAPDFDGLMAPKLPSAVTVAGAPVALDGDLVYLGGGLYAAASAPPREKAPPAPRRKGPGGVLPGRVRNPGPRPLGPRSAVRSASAHLVGRQSTGESPGHSRAQSDDGRSVAAAEKEKGPQPWRPGGRQKLPPPAPEPARSTRLGPGEGGLMPGEHSEARREARREARQEGVGLFGLNGLLGQLREGEASSWEGGSEAFAAPPPLPVARGPPENGARREAERLAAKKAKVEALLEERAEREALKAMMNRGAAGSRSAPALPAGVQPLDLATASAGQGKDDIERQKLRVACKMEILDFFNGYSTAVGKMTAEQTKLLLAKIQGGGAGDDLAGAVQQCEQQRVEQAQEWSAKSQKVDDQQNIQRRLQQVNDLCNKAFDVDDEEELML